MTMTTGNMRIENGGGDSSKHARYVENSDTWDFSEDYATTTIGMWNVQNAGRLVTVSRHAKDWDTRIWWGT